MTDRPPTTADHAEPGHYEIRIGGRLDERRASWFDGMTVTDGGDGTTVLRGPVADQAALHGLLQRVRDLGLPLITVTRTDPPPLTQHPARERNRE
jgi:hypothetical protein